MTILSAGNFWRFRDLMTLVSPCITWQSQGLSLSPSFAPFLLFQKWKNLYFSAYRVSCLHFSENLKELERKVCQPIP